MPRLPAVCALATSIGAEHCAIDPQEKDVRPVASSMVGATLAGGSPATGLLWLRPAAAGAGPEIVHGGVCLAAPRLRAVTREGAFPKA